MPKYSNYYFMATKIIQYQSKWDEYLESAFCSPLSLACFASINSLLFFSHVNVYHSSSSFGMPLNLNPKLLCSTHTKSHNTKMGCRVFMGFLFLFIFIFGTISEAQMVPAVYVFGDSLVDVGNNNYLRLSVARADHPYYGIDFPTHKPNGRFSNGKNAADFISEKLGLPTSPPYLSLVSKSSANKNNASFLDGVSFASSGAGIFNGTDERFRQSIPLTRQVTYYSLVYEEMKQEVGADALQKRLSKSIFAVVIGSNDMFGYLQSSNLRRKITPQQYLLSVVFSLKVQLQRLYDQGARKFEIAGIGALGCAPAFRVNNKTECLADANYWSVKCNEGLQSMLKEWQSENKDITYSFFDTYATVTDLILNPASYGFREVKAACCGLGELNAKGLCLPLSNLCSNRQDHIFWDLFHPTEAADRIFADRMFDGPSNYTYPINMRQLVAA